VTDQLSVDAAAAFVEASGVPLVALVNNAGISRAMPLELENVEESKHLFDVNVFGAMRFTSAFLPLLRKNQGRIVNVGSVAGLIVRVRLNTLHCH
jgi:NAD(P)-dependent dehydrogenase (short-subunit alcohol dehydrogenase family)